MISYTSTTHFKILNRTLFRKKRDPVKDRLQLLKKGKENEKN